jgi:hypothetical protein
MDPALPCYKAPKHRWAKKGRNMFERSLDMSKIRVFTIVLLIAMLAAFPIGNALAATNSATIGTGTIVNITMVTNAGVTSIMVDLLDSNGLAQTVTVSLGTAIGLGLVITNAASIATEATLTDINTALTTIGTVNGMDFDDPLVPTSLIVNLSPTPLDVVIDALTAQTFSPTFVVVDPVTYFMTAVDPADFLTDVTLTDVNTLVVTTGTVTSITVDDLASTTSTVTVNLTPDPTPFDVTIGLEDAVSNGFLIVNTAMVGESIVIDPSLVLDSTTYSNVVSRLGTFFGSTLGIDFATLAAYHDAGYGYGVISQALWMATNMEGDAATLDAILQAKLTGDFSALSTTATNWGQFRKEALSSGKQNLGQIMSGKADPVTTTTETTTTSTSTTDTKKNNGNGKSNGNSENHGNSNGKKP